MEKQSSLIEKSSLPSQLSYSAIVKGYQDALQIVEDVVLKNYITELPKMEVVPLSKRLLQTNLQENVRFFKITEMVYEKEEFATYKFASVYNALSISNSAIFIIIDSDGVKTDFYMGIRSFDEYRTVSSLKSTVENAMKGQFPGIKTIDYTIDEMEEILDGIKANSISAVSCVANNKVQDEDNKNFIQGLEKLVLAMQGEKYTGIIIANGTSQEQLKNLRKEYENVYTQLSAFASTQVNYASNNTLNYSVAETSGNSYSENHSTNSSRTDTRTETISYSTTHTESSENAAGKTVKSVGTAALLVGSVLAPLTGGISMTVGGVISGGLGLLGSAISKSISDSTSQSNSVANGYSTMEGVTDGRTESVNYGVSRTEGYNRGMTEGMTLTVHDKTVEDILERIDKQLKRIDEFESLGMYECAAYFLSEDQCTSEIAASTYKALMRGENSGVEIAAINSWGQFQKSKTQLIGEYVKNFIHPVFRYASSAGDIEVTPCSLVSGNELAIHMGLPRHSVCGLPVIEHANFGQEIVTYDRQKYSAGITLGNIFNMGNVCNNKTVLNLNSLAMHTFVTGSTGSGKSNTIYEIIRQLDNFGVSYLVIEPAKGEYKNIFGNYPDVHVFGTNPQFTEILRINPFKFPKGVHVLEHIDRLVELLNVCWPMYAAMPAVLKEAILQTYQACGWDLMESRNRYSDELFPTFRDLLDELVIVITRSAYSEEVKSNYIGSLVTRVKSLTNGLNSQIFSSDEVDNTTLFDKKVIVDISRIGSVETKSLIMGILIMRLNEYRVAFSTEMNMPLRHVTVLEEAHNILKRVSTEQNIEGANVAGKSVEMLSNAIAEMRTYGEGFIIADQSPSAVDISAIRNTNTKIIMRLPDEMDRRMAGKAAGLKDNQLDEIAKLPKGVAVVYQNDWVESVLCKVNRFRGEERAFKKTVISDPYNKDNDLVCILQNLLHKAKGESLDLNIKELTLRLINLDIDSRIKIQILKALRKNGTSSLEEISPAIYELLCSPEIEKEADNVESIEEWKNVFVYSNYGVMIKLSEMEQNQLLECILREEVERNKKPVEYLEDWKSFLKKELM